MIIRELRAILVTVLGFCAFGWSWLYAMGAAALVLIVLGFRKGRKAL